MILRKFLLLQLIVWTTRTHKARNRIRLFLAELSFVVPNIHEWKVSMETTYVSNSTFADENALSGVHFSFSLVLVNILNIVFSSQTCILHIPYKSERLKARSHDPFLRIRFLVPKTESRRSDGLISKFRFCGEDVGKSFVVCSHDPFFRTNKDLQFGAKTIVRNLSAPFIFQGECRMKIEHVLFPSAFV